MLDKMFFSIPKCTLTPCDCAPDLPGKIMKIIIIPLVTRLAQINGKIEPTRRGGGWRRSCSVLRRYGSLVMFLMADAPCARE